MKHVNLLNKLIIILSSSLFFLISCSNITESSKTVEYSNSKNGVTITGRISTQENARYAYASGSEIEWTLVAKKGRKVISAVIEGNTFEVTLTPGEWTLYASGFVGEYKDLVTGTKTLTIKEGETPSDISISASISEASLKKKYDGKISLEINDKSGIAAEALLSINTGDGTKINETAVFEDGLAKFSPDNRFNPGCYDAAITIKDSAGNTIFFCSEIIYVSPILTTDFWDEGGEYIEDGKFVLTKELIDTFKSSLHDTPIVLWNRLASDNNNAYRVGLQVFGDVNSSTVLSKSLLNTEANAWCFGENNSIYAFENFTNKSANENPSAFKIKKYCKDKSVYSKYEPCDKTVINDESTLCRVLNMDYSKDGSNSYLFILYGSKQYNKTFNSYDKYNSSGADVSEAASLKVYDVSSFNDEAPASITKAALTYTLSSIGFGDTPKVVYDTFGYSYVAANGSDVYVARKIGNVMEILPFKYDNTTPEKPELVYQGDENCIDIAGALTKEELNADYLSFSDMKVLGDYLYILLSKKFENSKNGTTGGVLKYKLSSHEFEKWADSSLLLGAAVQSNEFTQPDSSNEKRCFYGPRKIIAIKPDELYIADDGWEYDEDAKKAPGENYSDNNIKEKNRVVKVSLSSWAITSVKDVNFMFDGYAYYVGGNSGFVFFVD